MKGGIPIGILLTLGLAGTATAGGVVRPVIDEDGGYHPPPAAEGFTYPDCYCTDSQGDRVEIGQTACLQIGSQKPFLALCDMSLNSPTWRRQGKTCPVS